MLRNWSRRMTERLHVAAGWHRSRCECFAQIVCAAIATRSVKLDDLATQIPGKAKFASKTRRLQSFFLDFVLDYNAIARLLAALLEPLLGPKWLLAVDRTNWMRRGRNTNLLVLAVCLGDVAIPLFWTDLGQAGNSDTNERIALMKRFLAVFGADRIRAVTGDREFVGGNWFRWLKKREIPFVLRVRNNFKVTASSGRETEIRNCFRNLKLYRHRTLGERKICGVMLSVSGLRLPGSDYVIVVSHGVEPGEALGIYRQRWNIETLFEKLKSHGFDLEGSRLRGPGKMDKMLAALALATAWCYSFGAWHVRSVKPLRTKSHGRREKAVFRLGLDLLRQVLGGCASELARFSRIALALLNPPIHSLTLNPG